MTESFPCSVISKILGSGVDQHTSGFMATIEFANGCIAHIDANPRSRLGDRTGWILEGTTGSYRNDKLYTVASDGEIVDEPVQRPSLSGDPFIAELTSLWSGKATTLPTLADAARVVQLIEAIEQSQKRGEVIHFS